MKLSIVIPVYNSSKILKTLMHNINKHLLEKYKLIEVILVNDFSKDNSWETIKDLKYKYKYIKGINLKKNYGQHNAIFSGLKYCKGEKIVCMDDDMQHDPEHIPKMIEKLDNYEVCYVKYQKREHNFLKIFISKLNNIISSFLMNKSSKIYTSSFKCFTNKICQKIIASNLSFIFLDYLIFKYSKNISFIPVKHNKRLSGKTNYGLKQLVTLWSKMIFIIEAKPNSLRYYLLILLKFLFKSFFKKYISFKLNEKIEILEIV